MKTSKFAKFLIIGVTAISVIVPIVTQAGQNIPPLFNSYNNSASSRMEQIVLNAYLDNLTTKNVIVNIKKSFDDDANKLVDNSMSLKADGSCEVNLTLDSNNEIKYSGSEINSDIIKETISINSGEEAEIIKEFTALHEVAHCKFYNSDEVFKTPGNEKLEKDVNFYFKHAYVYGTFTNNIIKKTDGIYSLVNEAYADTVAFIQLAKKYNFNSNFLVAMTKWQTRSQEVSLNLRLKGHLESHDVHYALKNLLDSDNLNIIKNLKTEKDIHEYALLQANKAMFDSLVNTNIDLSISIDSIINGIYMKIANSEYNKKEMKNGKSASDLYVIGGNIVENEKSLVNDIVNKFNRDKSSGIFDSYAKKLNKELLDEGYYPEEIEEATLKEYIKSKITPENLRALRSTITEYQSYIADNGRINELDTLTRFNKEEVTEKVTRLQINVVNKIKQLRSNLNIDDKIAENNFKPI